jgi:glycosyltransferase involved in cell wall biosynthesis
VTTITAVLNVHREGILAHASVLSIARARQVAEAAGIAVEVIAVADCSDRATLDTLAEANGVRVLETNVDDLGLARNAGVAAATGKYIAFLDGDDLWGPNWLLAAYEAALNASAVIWHPEASLFFGPTQKPYWLIHPEMETIEGDWVSLGIRNQWTSLSFAQREIYLQTPYRGTDLATGFGYEDWSWNSEVVAKGCIHKTVQGTTHLVRVQDTSLLRRTIATDALMMPSSLMRSRIGWAARVGSMGVAAPLATTDHPADVGDQS